MIRGLHGLFYSSEPEAMRAFLRDKVRLPHTDVGEGWLIFDLPEGDVGVHPVDDSGQPSRGTHDVSFYCDDIEGTVTDLKSRGVQFKGPVQDHGYGFVTYFTMPGGVDVQLYEPKYQKSSRPASAGARNEVWNLRSGRSWRRMRDVFAASCGRFGMRLVQFSIQGNHVHLIVEADCHESLSRGMQGLCVRIAKALNSMMQRENHTHHFGESGVDPYSSAALLGEERELVLALPHGCLLRAGWRRSKRLPSTAMRVVQFGAAT